MVLVSPANFQLYNLYLLTLPDSLFLDLHNLWAVTFGEGQEMQFY